MEEWRDVEGFNGLYQVSNYGRVRSLDRVVKRKGYVLQKGKVLSPAKSSTGYMVVQLTGINHKRVNVSVHRLVAKAFCKQEDGANEVNHKNGKKDDNRAENLEWCTHRQNVKHRYDVLGQKADCRKLRKLTNNQVKDVRESNEGLRSLARKYGVTLRVIRAIKNRETYREVI